MTLPGSSKHKFNNMSILMHQMQKIQNESNLDANQIPNSQHVSKQNTSFESCDNKQ